MTSESTGLTDQQAKAVVEAALLASDKPLEPDHLRAAPEPGQCA